MIREIVQVFQYVRGGKVAGVAHASVRESAQLHDLLGQIRSDDSGDKRTHTHTPINTECVRHRARVDSPKTFVHAGVYGQTVLVPVDVVRVHPRASDAVGLFERYARELGVFGEILQRRQTGGPATDDAHGRFVRTVDARRRRRRRRRRHGGGRLFFRSGNLHGSGTGRRAATTHRHNGERIRLE